MSTLATKPLRWSSVRNCPRLAVYEATDAPARERTLKEDRQLFRGRSVGHDWVVSVASEKMWKVWVDSGSTHWLPPHLAAVSEDEADVIAECRVQWEMGTGHADLYIRETDTVVEVLSSQNPTGDMIHSKLIQARGYARALDADNLALIVVDPATLDEERVIVTFGTARWDDLERECDERVAQLLEWRDEGTLPARVCGKPGEAWGHFCQYAEHCFDGYTPPALDTITDERTHELVARDFHARQKEREIKATLKLIETERKEIEAELAEQVEPGKWQVGNYQVNRSPRTRKTFKLPLAEQDSRIPQPLLDEFTSVSSYEVWTVERAGVTGEVDYGEEAPF
jgi:hypothetical protein